MSCSRTRCSDTGEVRSGNPSVSSQALYHIGFILTPNSIGNFRSDITFYFQTTLKKNPENLRQVLNTFENIIENRAFSPKGANALFSIIFSNT